MRRGKRRRRAANPRRHTAARYCPAAAPLLGTHKVPPTTNLMFKPPNFSDSSANSLAKRSQGGAQSFVLYITP